MSDDPAVARKRLAMRSMRRGIKEMDLILSDYATRTLPGMEAEELAHYEALLSENDQAIYAWICGTEVPPERFAALIDRIAAGAEGVVRR
ncbi:MAG: succinate dehydrogenase assembly factor 2 [Paracoccaceae bacterium]